MKSYITAFDRSLSRAVAATFNQSWRPFFEYMTFLGEPVVVCSIAFVIGVYALTKSMNRLLIASLSIPATLIIGSLLKLLFERARPMTEYTANMRIHTFSFPSGHSSGSMITYGLLAYLAYKTLPQPFNIIVAILLAIIPFAVGISRIYLGAHFPSDVLAGWLLGFIALIIVITVVKPL